MLRLKLAICAALLGSLLTAACGGGGASPNPNPQNQPPVAAISASQTSGTAPLAVNFSAAASSDPDGTIAAFAWDLDGNGSFETTTGATSTAQRTFNDAGTFIVRVRVADNAGATATASVQITVAAAGVFDTTIDIPPVESFDDKSALGDGPALFWRKNFYHTLPAVFDTDRVFQNLSISRWADEILRLTNIERANNGGLPALVRDDHLEMVMQAHCRDMALRNYFDHNTLEDFDPFQRLDAINPPFYTAAAENIAAGQTSPAQVVTGWMNSAGHRGNILNGNLRRIGIGVYFDAHQGPAGQRFYFGQLFATYGAGVDPDTHDWIEISESP